MCVCDAYVAMISDRTYRTAMTPAAARAELTACSGTQFDPHLAEELLVVLAAVDSKTLPCAGATVSCPLDSRTRLKVPGVEHTGVAHPESS